MDWTTVAVASVTAIAGMAGGLLPIWYGNRRAADRERKGVRSAILAEVTALKVICEERGYLQAIRDGYQYRHSDGYSLTVRVPEHYCIVYRSNLTRLGALDPGEAALIVQFYQLIDSVVQDIIPGGILAEMPLDYEDEGRAAFYRTSIILEKALALADQLCGPAALPTTD